VILNCFDDKFQFLFLGHHYHTWLTRSVVTSAMLANVLNHLMTFPSQLKLATFLQCFVCLFSGMLNIHYPVLILYGIL